eukprot:COSAG02_NODE_10729_length_1872_cov_2.003948_1_plen_168_part_00
MTVLLLPAWRPRRRLASQVAMSEGAEGGAMSEEDTMIAIGFMVMMVLLTLFIIDQCKRRRNNEQAMSHANRVQQNRTARPDGSAIIDHKSEKNHRNNTGDYRAVSYEHNNPSAGKKRGGPTMVRALPISTPACVTIPPPQQSSVPLVAAGLDPRHGWPVGRLPKLRE